MKSIEDMDMRKLIGTIIGIVVFICCALFFTFAWYTWESEHTNVIMTIEDATIKCIPGPDVTVSNIGPVLNYQDGVKTDFSIENVLSSSSNISLSLNITSITETLLVESFQYKVVQDVTGGTDYDYDNPILSGDFSDFEVGNNLITSALSVGANSTYSFQFIVYINGSVYNNLNMMEDSMNATLNLGDCGTVVESE